MENNIIRKPYGYQGECAAKILKAMSQELKAGFIFMASGLGKTITAAFLAKQLLMQNLKIKVLYLCNQTYILGDDQAPAKFQAIIGGDEKRFGQYHGSRKNRNAQFLFASFQTMDIRRRNFKRDEFNLVIVDESHHAPAETYLPTLQYFRPKFMLGMTATPDRVDTRDMRAIFHGNELYRLPLEEAIPRGLLTTVDYRIITDEIVNEGKIEDAKETGIDVPVRVTIKQLNRRLFAPMRDEEIVRIIGEKIAEVPNPKVMIFCPSIKYAERMHQLIPYSLPVHSRMSRKKQEERIKLFRDGLVHTILTVDKFNEGVDIPEVNVVVFLRSTQSHVIFTQQLGRGLRRHEGKEKVLVLDFVANCERVEMIHNLVQEIEKRYVPDAYKPRTVHFRFNFTEAARNVLDILRRIRAGYTPEELIKQLQVERKRLGRIPTIKDIAKSSMAGETASPTTYRKRFGGWNKALKAAGFDTNWDHNTESELIHQIQTEGKRLGRTPTICHIIESSKAGRTASVETFKRRFPGGWNKVLKAAGFDANRDRPETELLKQIRAEAKRLGRPPTMDDINKSSKARRTASVTTYLERFGGKWNKVLKTAKLLK